MSLRFQCSKKQKHGLNVGSNASRQEHLTPSLRLSKSSSPSTVFRDQTPGPHNKTQTLIAPSQILHPESQTSTITFHTTGRTNFPGPQLGFSTKSPKDSHQIARSIPHSIPKRILRSAPYSRASYTRSVFPIAQANHPGCPLSLNLSTPVLLPAQPQDKPHFILLGGVIWDRCRRHAGTNA